MNNISLQNSQINRNLNLEELKKKEPSFCAKKNKEEKDSVELKAKAKKEKSFVGEVADSVKTTVGEMAGYDGDKKKFIKSIILSILSIVGLAIAGNLLSPKFAKLGIKLDNFLLGSNNFIAKGYKKVGQFLSRAKTGITSTLSKNKFFKETIEDITETFQKRKVKQKCDVTRGYANGDRGIFAFTPIDTIQKAFKHIGNEASQKEAIRKLVGDGKVDEFFNMLNSKTKLTNVEQCKKLTAAIAENFGCANDKGKLLEILEGLKKGSINGIDVSEFKDVIMMDKGFSPFKIMGDWWPVRIIDKAGEKIMGAKWKGFGRGNLGDALIKFNMANNGLAKTMPAKFLQHGAILFPESFSNFVNDKSGLGVLLGLQTIVPMWQNIQDAPKEKKVPTFTNELVSNALGWAIAMPAAFAGTYSLASMKNIEGKTLATRISKTFGRFFGLGLDKITKYGTIVPYSNKFTAKAAGIVGGGIRFAMIMIASSKIRDLINKASHKVLGTPYNKAEAQKEAQIEAQRNAIIPELGISALDLQEKIQKNPQAMQALEQNPKALEILQKNPKALVEILDGKSIETVEKETLTQQTSKKPKMSQATANFLKNRENKATQPTTNQAKNTTVNNSSKENKKVDTATYIPSSKVRANQAQALSEEVQQKYDEVMRRADVSLQSAQKYL